MANGVKFLRGLYSNYNSLTTKDTDTLYITGASQGSYDSIYLGEHLLGSTSLGKLPFDATSYNDTYNGEKPFTESNLSAATTLLDVIAVLENKIDNATGADHAVTSIYGMTGAVTFSNAFTAEDGEAQSAHVVFVKNDSAKEIRGKLAINVPELFGESEIDANTSETIEPKDLIQIVTGAESGNITLAKVKALLANPAQKPDSEDYKSWTADGFMLMSTTADYVARVVSGDIAAAIDSHKNESDAHTLKNISSVDETTGQYMSNTITLSTGDWAFAHKLIDATEVANNLKTAGDAQELTKALFDAITASLTANKEYTDNAVQSVAIEWGTIEEPAN